MACRLHANEALAAVMRHASLYRTRCLNLAKRIVGLSDKENAYDPLLSINRPCQARAPALLGRLFHMGVVVFATAFVCVICVLHLSANAQTDGPVWGPIVTNNDLAHRTSERGKADNVSTVEAGVDIQTHGASP